MVADNPELREYMQEALQNSSGFKAVGEDGFSEYSIMLNGGLPAERAASLGSRPNIVGILRSETRPDFYRVGYQVVDMRGNKLAQGDIVGIGQDETAMFPALPEATATDIAIKDAVTQLVQTLNQQLQNTPWRSAVVKQAIESGMVSIAGDQQTGLRPGMIFNVENMPQTELELVGFENGYAQLKARKGELPPVGYIVIRN